MDFSLRVNRKAIATDSSPDRCQQFRYISSLRIRFERRGPMRVNDHEFRSDAIGVAILCGTVADEELLAALRWIDKPEAAPAIVLH